MTTRMGNVSNRARLPDKKNPTYQNLEIKSKRKI